MAIVLHAFASYLGDLLKQVAQEEVTMLLGIRSQISSLGEKLQLLEDFLADAERKRITDAHVGRWVGKLKGVMYQATDIVELCQLKGMERGTPEEYLGCCNSLLFSVRHPLFAHEIGRRIKALNRSLDDIKKQGDDFKFGVLRSYEDQRLAAPLRSRKTSHVVDLSSIVGEKIEEDTRQLVELLTKRGETSHAPMNNKIIVVAIVGVGGIGKTTFAKKIFHEAAIQDTFDLKIWLSVTQNVNETDLLRTAITAAGGDHHGNQERSLLDGDLLNSVRDKKFFLILDDMWRDDEWNNLLKDLFSHGAQGSRVLVTTRDERVARGMQAACRYHVNKLGRDDAWLLLKKQVAPSEIEQSDLETLKDTGMEIIGRCDGLPLAIKVIGGILRKRDMNRNNWEKVLNDDAWSVAGMPDELNHALYLSFDDLSPHLKQCFLHYSLIPKNIYLGCEGIISMWISEGFVPRSKNELEELGRDYYHELIERNLIEPATTVIDGEIQQLVDHQHCVMHDVVRSFAQYVARDEALVAHNGDIVISKFDSQTRFSIYNSGLKSDELEWALVNKNKKPLRTLMSIGKIFKIRPNDSVNSLSSLRILVMASTNCAPLVGSLCQLKHLRYLNLDSTDISELPADIGKMRFLQHISVCFCINLRQLPASIVRLGQLRYLDVRRTQINRIPRGFSGLTNLRCMRGFPGVSELDDWCSLEELGPLSELSRLELLNLESVPCRTSASMARLSTKKHLTNLSLQCTGARFITEEEKQRSEEVYQDLHPAPSLEILEIKGYFGRRLPDWMMSVTLPSLRILLMEDLYCCTHLPSGLCQLPNLELLQIKRAPAVKHVGPEFLHDHTRPLLAPAFPKLVMLLLVGMVEWEEWEWPVGIQTLPALCQLLLTSCKLRHLPPGPAFPNLKTLVLIKNPNLERVSGFPTLHTLKIFICPEMKVVEGLPALRKLYLADYGMDALPGYLRAVEPLYLELHCSVELLSSIAMAKDGPEWDVFSHVQRVRAYADDGGVKRKWYVVYTREPYYFETNIIVKIFV